jgi:flagellar protein FlbD
MIKLTKLDGEALVVNAELIESIGAAPETLLSMTTGRKIWVRETPDEVVRLALGYQALVRHEAAAIAPSVDA